MPITLLNQVRFNIGFLYSLTSSFQRCKLFFGCRFTQITIGLWRDKLCVLKWTGAAGGGERSLQIDDTTDNAQSVTNVRALSSSVCDQLATTLTTLSVKEFNIQIDRLCFLTFGTLPVKNTAIGFHVKNTTRDFGVPGVVSTCGKKSQILGDALSPKTGSRKI